MPALKPAGCRDIMEETTRGQGRPEAGLPQKENEVDNNEDITDEW